MAASEAIRIATGSPRSPAAARSRRIIAVNRPRRRWLLATPTSVIASAAISPPGTVSRVGNDRNVATTRSPSNPPSVRARSTAGRRKAASGTGSASSCSAASITATQAANSSAATARISTGIRRRYRCPVPSAWSSGHPGRRLDEVGDGSLRHGRPDRGWSRSRRTGGPQRGAQTLVAADRVAPRSGVSPGQRARRMRRKGAGMPSEEHVRRFAEIFGAAGEAVLERLRPWSPRLRAHVYDYIAGDLYADPALPVRTRELVVIATLAAQGGMAEQLAVHLQVALDNGATVAEIITTLETVGTYAGVPRALNALFTAAEVFARRGSRRASRPSHPVASLPASAGGGPGWQPAAGQPGSAWRSSSRWRSAEPRPAPACRRRPASAARSRPCPWRWANARAPATGCAGPAERRPAPG